MSTPLATEPQSPEYFEVPKKGEGTKTVNWKPKAIWVGCLAMLGIGVAYSFYDKSLEVQQAARDEIMIVSGAVPPVKKPIGPDLIQPVAMPVLPGQPYSMDNPTPMDEAAKQAAMKQAAELDAVRKAPSRVEGFGTNASRNTDQVPPPPGYPGQIPPPPPPDQYDQEGNRVAGNSRQQADFLKASNQYSPYLKHTREAALSQYEVKAGFFIPGITISAINSELEGMITGQVRQNVYDSATGSHMLIPAGARLVGRYDSRVVAGQEAVLVAWDRIIFPDGSSVFLDTMPGADQMGMAGFKDQVNNHYLRTFGQALLLSILGAGMQIGLQPNRAPGQVGGLYDPQQIAAAQFTQQLGQIGMQQARQNLNRPATLEIRPGYHFNIMVNKDIILPPYQPMQTRN